MTFWIFAVIASVKQAMTRRGPAPAPTLGLDPGQGEAEAEVFTQRHKDDDEEQVAGQQHQHRPAQPPAGETLHEPHRQRRYGAAAALVPGNVGKSQRSAQNAPIPVFKFHEAPVKSPGKAVVVFVLFTFFVPAGRQHWSQRERDNSENRVANATVMPNDRKNSPMTPP